MKANNGTGNNIERDEWETPEWLFDILDKQYYFDFDCCATSRNTKLSCYPFNFLEYNVAHVTMAWMNPPFSKALEMFKHFFKVVKKGVAIYRCDNFETKIWQEIIFPNASWIFIPNKRIVYEGLNGKGARFPSALIGYKVNPPKELDGIILFTSKHKEGVNQNKNKP